MRKITLRLPPPINGKRNRMIADIKPATQVEQRIVKTAKPKKIKPGKRNKVFILGDSLTVGSKPHLKRQLKSRVHVDAKISRTTTAGLKILKRSKAAKAANTWVIALGTNDAPNPKRVKKDIRQVTGLAKKYKINKIIWLTVVRPGGYGKTNKVIKQAGKTNSKLIVLDWANYLTKRKKLLRSDRVHYTHTGYKQRSKLIVKHVKAAWKTNKH